MKQVECLVCYLSVQKLIVKYHAYPIILQYSLEGHQFAVFAFRLSSDKRYVVSISSRVISWDLSTSDLARDLCPQLEGIMQNLEMSPDNKWAAAATNNSVVSK